MGVKEGLLALLIDGPRHGYQLKIDLEAATGDAIRVNVGQVYTTLQRLERDGYVVAGSTDSSGRVAYHLTEDGRTATKDWIAKPEDLATAGRDEVSMKLLIALFSDNIDPSTVVETQRRATMSQLQDYAGLRSRDESVDLAWQLHLDRLFFSAEAELKWLDRIEERLANQGDSQEVPKRDRTEEEVR